MKNTKSLPENLLYTCPILNSGNYKKLAMVVKSIFRVQRCFIELNKKDKSVCPFVFKKPAKC